MLFRPTVDQTTPLAIDDFEQDRRNQETRNELFFSWVYLITLIVGLISAMSNELYLWMAFHTPKSIFIMWIIGAILFSGLIYYLKYLSKTYFSLRKYILIVFQTIFLAIGTLLYQGTLEPTIVYACITIIFITSIVLAGTRYSTNLVIFTGIFNSIVYMLLLLFAPGELIVSRMVITIFSITFFILVTIIVTYNVSSLIHMHRESVWKERLRRFLAPELVDELTHKPELLSQKVERRVATVLFADIRGFTALSEQLQPEEVVNFLNLFLEEMSVAIMNQHGMVDKYIGDAIMGVFGVPLDHQEHASQAVQAAIEMQARLIGLNARLAQQRLPTLDLGIGIHTGPLVVGAIGSPHRLDYTVIGDTVNVASRVEALTRHYPTTILFSDATKNLLPDTLPIEMIGSTQVKNRVEPIALWKIVEKHPADL